MFLTDGGTEMPEEVFEKYNSNLTVRIFSYAVGPTANPVAAVRWIACQNKGIYCSVQIYWVVSGSAGNVSSHE